MAKCCHRCTPSYRAIGGNQLLDIFISSPVTVSLVYRANRQQSFVANRCQIKQQMCGNLLSQINTKLLSKVVVSCSRKLTSNYTAIGGNLIWDMYTKLQSKPATVFCHKQMPNYKANEWRINAKLLSKVVAIFAANES